MERLQTDGGTFEAFCADPVLWQGGAYIEHSVVTINGVRLEDHTGDIAARDRVDVYGGYVYFRYGVQSLRDCFERWRHGVASAD